MSTENKTIFQNVLVLSLTEILATMFSVFLVMVVARKLGPSMMGIYAFGVTFITLIQVFVDFGLVPYIQREVGRRPDQASELLTRLFIFKFVVYGFAVLIVLALIPWLAPDYPKNAVVLILMAAMFFRSNIHAICAFFRARHMSHLEATVRVGMRLLYTSVGIGIIWSGYGLVPLVTVEFIVHVLALVLALWLFHRRIAALTFRFTFTGIIKQARATYNFLLINVVQSVFNSIDVFMLSLLSGDRATGFYEAGMRLTNAFEPIPKAFSGAYLPVLSRTALTEREEFHRAFKLYFRYHLLAGAGLTAVLIGLSRAIMLLVFGEEFLSAFMTLKILSVTMFLTYANWPLSMAIFAQDKERSILNAFAVCAVANILMNFWLIPQYADQGAAMATVASQVIFMAMQCGSLGWGFLRAVNLAGLVAGPVATLVLTLLLITWVGTYELGLIFNLASAFLGYVVIALLTRSIRINEIKTGLKYLLERRASKKSPTVDQENEQP